MALREVIQEIRDAIEAGDAIDANEQEAKAWFITPIVEALGWRGRSRVRFEYSPPGGSLRMDYALQGPDKATVALIEAKAPGQDLTAHVTQTLNYAFHEGIPLCALTTGVDWWLYLSLDETSAPHERFFAKLDMRTDPAEEIEDCILSCLGYDAVVGGSARDRAKRMLDDRRNQERLLAEIPRAWRRLLDQPDDLLIELVQEDVRAHVGLTPNREQIATFLRNSLSRAQATQSPTPVPPPVTTGPGTGSGSPNPPFPDKPLTGFALWGVRHSVRQWSGLWLGVAEAVYDRHSHEFERAFQLRGRTRQYITPSREGHINARRIGNSPYYADVNLSAVQCVRRAGKLLEHFGYRADELEIRYD